jgi:hypothetical protein
MTNPVICSDGHSYEAVQIAAYMWHRQREGLPLSSPMNPSHELDETVMIPNRDLKSLVLEFMSQGR